MLWVRVLGAILLWFPLHYEALRTQQRGTGSKSYQISPKPCEVNNLKGTCMFVWECINSEGEHLGMCVDSFMFGSCCSHNQASNSIQDSDSGAANSSHNEGPQILYSPPSQQHTHHHQNHPQNHWSSSTTATSTASPHTTTTKRPHYPSNLGNKKNNTNFYVTASHNSNNNYNNHHTSHKPTDNIHGISLTNHVTKKPSNNVHHSGSQFITSAATSYPSHGLHHHTVSTIRSTTPSSVVNRYNITSPPKGGSSHRPDPWKNRPNNTSSGTNVWHVTTEPGFITKPQRPNKPTIIILQKPKPSKKPTTPQQTNKPNHNSGGTTPSQHNRPIYNRPNSTTLNLIINRPNTPNNNKPSSITTLNLLNKPLPSAPLPQNHPYFPLSNYSGPNYMPGDVNFDPKPPMLTSMLTSTLPSNDDLLGGGQTPSPTGDSMMPTSTLISVSAATSGDRKAKCGVTPMFPRPEKRIVGGKNAPFGRWPWQVSVRRTSFFGFSSTHRCGGAILNENWIATAGHCVDDLLTSQIRIRVGEYDFSKQQEEYPYVERMVSKKVVHPKYNFFTYEYDLALVRLDKPLEFKPHISPICLPASDDLLIGENATVTGWGRLSEGGTLPSVLQEVQVPIVSNDRCKSMFLRAGRHEFIPEIFLCAGHERGGMDSCQGDSGGPLQVKGKDGRYFLAGIISWGIGCAEANLPGVCTRISKFVPWILENVT